MFKEKNSTIHEQLSHRHATFTFNQNIAAAQLQHQQKRLADLLYLSHFLFLSHIGRRPDLARYPDNKAELVPGPYQAQITNMFFPASMQTPPPHTCLYSHTPPPPTQLKCNILSNFKTM